MFYISGEKYTFTKNAAIIKSEQLPTVRELVIIHEMILRTP